MEYFVLNNGYRIPKIGSGTNTFGKVDNQYMGELTGDYSSIITAIESGYRFFDTAISYRNEALLGKALTASGMPRDEFFISTKIPSGDDYTSSPEKVRIAVLNSLTNLETEYIDLYFIHHPWDDLDEILSTYQVLESFVDAGVIRSIGVSNFSVEQLKWLQRNVRIQPVSNQIVSNPGNWNDELIAYCKKHQILPMAWGPLKQVNEISKKKLENIGLKHKKTWAQVLLRYQLDRDVCVIPKSHHAKRQRENIEVLDFTLSKVEQNQIAKLSS